MSKIWLEEEIFSMVLIARGRIEDTNGTTFTFSTAHDYLLAHDCGHEILYLLEGDPDYIGPFETYLVEVRGELAGTDPTGRYEILEVKSIYRNERNS